MKKLNIHFLLFSVFAFSITITAHAESIYFSFTDGTQAAYNLTTVRNITFTGDVMNLTKTDGTVFHGMSVQFEITVMQPPLALMKRIR